MACIFKGQSTDTVGEASHFPLYGSKKKENGEHEDSEETKSLKT